MPDDELRALLQNTRPNVEPTLGAEGRVRQRVYAALQPTRSQKLRRLVPALALAAVAVALLFGFPFERTQTGAPATSLDTADGAASLIRLTRAKLLLRPGTELKVERDDSAGALVNLLAGSVFVSVEPGERIPFAVQAGDIRIEVTGTLFGVHRAGNDSSVNVLEGTVRVHKGALIESVSAGTTWGNIHPEFAKALTEEQLALLSYPKHEQIVPPPPLPSSGADSVPARPPGGASSRLNGERQKRAPVNPVSETSAYLKAKQLEQSGRIPEALENYAAIANSLSSSAEDAQFALIRIRANLRENATALNAASVYKARYPGGRYARAVDVYYLDLLLNEGKHELALEEAKRFVANHPSDPRAWRFRLVIAEANAKSGDCSAARVQLEHIPQDAPQSSALKRCASP